MQYSKSPCILTNTIFIMSDHLTEYDHFKELVSKMLAAEEVYYRSGKTWWRRDKQKLAIWVSYRNQVKEFITPTKNTQVKQATFNWLAQ